MSKGYGAKCNLISIDEGWIIFEYSSYNLNHENYKEALDTLDGKILIREEFFPKPEIVTKRIRKANGKKVWIEKKKYIRKDYVDFYKEGKITIQNSSHCWKLTNSGVDVFAFDLLFHMQIEYEKQGKIPKKLGIFS